MIKKGAKKRDGKNRLRVTTAYVVTACIKNYFLPI
jgi:hypothetical protein